MSGPERLVQTLEVLVSFGIKVLGGAAVLFVTLVAAILNGGKGS